MLYSLSLPKYIVTRCTAENNGYEDPVQAYTQKWIEVSHIYVFYAQNVHEERIKRNSYWSVSLCPCRYVCHVCSYQTVYASCGTGAEHEE
jgi:hypothetical protein